MDDDDIITLDESELVDLLKRLKDENEFNLFIETHGVDARLRIRPKRYGCDLIDSILSVFLTGNYSRLLERLIERGAHISDELLGSTLSDCFFVEGSYPVRILLAYGAPVVPVVVRFAPFEIDVLWRVILEAYRYFSLETKHIVRMLLETENVYDKSLWRKIGNFFSTWVPPLDHSFVTRMKCRYTIDNMIIITFMIENMM